MAVEKMHLVNITSKLENLDDFLEDVIDLGDIEPVDAFNQVASRAFSIRASKENVELTEDISTISSFEKPNKAIIEKLNLIKDLFSISSTDRKKSKHISDEDIDRIYNSLKSLIDKKNELLEEKQNLEEYKRNLETLDKFGIDIRKIKNLNYFDHRFGEVSKDGRYILKNNYDNLPSLILHLDNNLDNVSLTYLNELINLDKETSKLRADTDRVISNEKENTFNVISELDKQYQAMTKEKSDEIYSNIMREAEVMKEEIKSNSKEIKGKLDDIYENQSKEIVDEITSSIIEGRDK
ncbi:hypothetical protein [Anaerococcus tetradius]|uniref:hypothetical protein n=1 Tax=Anaerococcus tetradius TaxID=33036 RepID=UPI0023F45711|nr:hypothetical protein [Anaerococcus tetradius]